jgi:hypothetical protein
MKQKMAFSDRRRRIPSGTTNSGFSWRTYIFGREAWANKRSVYCRLNLLQNWQQENLLPGEKYSKAVF